MADATVTKVEKEGLEEEVDDPEPVPEITLEDLPELCRLCLKKKDSLSVLEPELLEFYKRCIERPLEVKDELPSKICEKCFSYLDSMDTFIKETARNRRCKIELEHPGEGPITLDDDSLGADEKENKTVLKRKLGLVKEDPDDDVKPKKPKTESVDGVKEEDFEGLQEEVVEIKDEDEDSEEENEDDLDEDEDINEDELDGEEDEDEDVGVDSEEEVEDDEEDEDEEEGEEGESDDE